MSEDINPQIAKDDELAKRLGREPVVREGGETDASYIRRLRRAPRMPPTLTEDQIKLAHDMHAVHSAMSRGYVLPPLPVTDEQRADDEAKAEEMGVQPVEREPGETDEAFDARLAASPKIEKPPVAAEPAPIAPLGKTIYPSHVDKPAFEPVEHPAPVNSDA